MSKITIQFDLDNEKDKQNFDIFCVYEDLYSAINEIYHSSNLSKRSLETIVSTMKKYGLEEMCNDNFQ